MLSILQKVFKKKLMHSKQIFSLITKKLDLPQIGELVVALIVIFGMVKPKPKEAFKKMEEYCNSLGIEGYGNKLEWVVDDLFQNWLTNQSIKRDERREFFMGIQQNIPYRLSLQMAKEFQWLI
jgi:hypothetical protein